MAALGIPTTRALSIVGSHQEVYRESVENGAIMARVSPSNIRFGHFEYWFHQGKIDLLTKLADYCIDQYYPEGKKALNPYLYMFEQVVLRTADLIAKWQAHGFAHGVMNTDNMSILGLTIDYGPFGFLDDYNPGFICNHSDSNGRYAFDEQPSVGLWNLNALALTFSTWLSKEEITTTLQKYEPRLVSHYLSIMASKLGLEKWVDTDQALLGQLLTIMAKQKSDYSLTFRLLNTVLVEDVSNNHCSELLVLFQDTTELTQWLIKYRQRLSDNALALKQRVALQNQTNAQYILRNYLAQSVIQQAELGDYSTLELLQCVLSTPFVTQSGAEKFAQQPPQWGKHLEISCSS